MAGEDRLGFPAVGIPGKQAVTASWAPRASGSPGSHLSILCCTQLISNPPQYLWATWSSMTTQTELKETEGGREGRPLTCGQRTLPRGPSLLVPTQAARKRPRALAAPLPPLLKPRVPSLFQSTTFFASFHSSFKNRRILRSKVTFPSPSCL